MRAIYVFWLACLVLAILPPIFIWNKVYKDGVIGRIFLSGISICATLFLLDPFFGEDQYDPAPLGVALAVSVAGFMAWHLYRFHSRVLKRRDCAPDCTERRVIPDRRFSR